MGARRVRCDFREQWWNPRCTPTAIAHTLPPTTATTPPLHAVNILGASNVRFTNCNFGVNYADNMGGAVKTVGSNVTFSTTAFYQNRVRAVPSSVCLPFAHGTFGEQQQSGVGPRLPRTCGAWWWHTDARHGRLPVCTHPARRPDARAGLRSKGLAGRPVRALPRWLPCA